MLIKRRAQPLPPHSSVIPVTIRSPVGVDLTDIHKTPKDGREGCEAAARVEKPLDPRPPLSCWWRQREFLLPGPSVSTIPALNVEYNLTPALSTAKRVLRRLRRNLIDLHNFSSALSRYSTYLVSEGDSQATEPKDLSEQTEAVLRAAKIITDLQVQQRTDPVPA